jgi:sucrose-phosphate synthase
VHIAFLNPQGNFDPLDRYWTEHPDFGGQLVYVKEVALALGEMGHEVDILTRRVRDPDWTGFEGDLDGYPDGDRVRIIRVPCGGDQFLRKEDLWPYLGTEWVPNIITLYSREDRLPDVFTAHYADGGLGGALMEQQTGIPFTFTGHSLGAQKMDKLGASVDTIASLDAEFRFSTRIIAERVSMNHAARVITSTMQERREQYAHPAYLGAVDPTDDKRFTIVPPGVNLRIFDSDPEPSDAEVLDRILGAIERDISAERRGLPLVLASSRLDEKKNHIGLLRAFSASAALRELSNLAIVIRGLADPLHEWTQLAGEEAAIMATITEHMSANELWGVVTAFPLNSQIELAAAYRALADRQSVFALTALYEPFGLAPLEAMSCGLPAVVTRNGGPSESLIEGEKEFGVLVDPADPEDIASGILRVLESAETWHSFREAGIERVLSRYTWDRTAQGYADVFEKVRHESRDEERFPIPLYFTDPSQEISTEELSRIYFR